MAWFAYNGKLKLMAYWEGANMLVHAAQIMSATPISPLPHQEETDQSAGLMLLGKQLL